MTRLKTPDELRTELSSRRPDEALRWLVDWLERRDVVSGQLAVDDFADNLTTLAAEFRREARETSTTSAGLELAATVLDDAAFGVRVGDQLSAA